MDPVKYPSDLSSEEIDSMVYSRIKFLANRYASIFSYDRILENVEVFESVVSDFFRWNKLEEREAQDFRRLVSLPYLDSLIEDLELRGDLINQIPRMNGHVVYRGLRKRFPSENDTKSQEPKR